MRNTAENILISEILATLNSLVASQLPARYGDPIPGDTYGVKTQNKIIENAIAGYLEELGLKMGPWSIQMTEAYLDLFKFNVKLKQDRRYKWNQRGVMESVVFVPAFDLAAYGVQDVTLKGLKLLARLKDQEDRLVKSEAWIVEAKVQLQRAETVAQENRDIIHQIKSQL